MLGPQAAGRAPLAKSPPNPLLWQLTAASLYVEPTDFSAYERICTPMARSPTPVNRPVKLYMSLFDAPEKITALLRNKACSTFFKKEKTRQKQKGVCPICLEKLGICELTFTADNGAKKLIVQERVLHQVHKEGHGQKEIIDKLLDAVSEEEDFGENTKNLFFSYEELEQAYRKYHETHACIAIACMICHKAYENKKFKHSAQDQNGATIEYVCRPQLSPEQRARIESSFKHVPKKQPRKKA